ncbi:unnamed protein product, partial [Discosporangium mesarthrocarpum]
MSDSAEDLLPPKAGSDAHGIPEERGKEVQAQGAGEVSSPAHGQGVEYLETEGDSDGGNTRSDARAGVERGIDNGAEDVDSGLEDGNLGRVHS